MIVLLAQGTVTFGADSVKWTDVGIFAATVTLAIVTALLFNATRNMAAQTKTLAQKTADMATRTAELATDTVDASNRADEHHQQSLWPFVVVSEIGNFEPYWIALTLHNIGAGPARTVYIERMSVNGNAVPNIREGLQPMYTGQSYEANYYYYAANDPRRAGAGAPDTFRFRVVAKTMFRTESSTVYEVSRIHASFQVVDETLPDIVTRQ